MNKLFKLIIFSLLLSTQLFPQSISRLKAKKEREKENLVGPWEENCLLQEATRAGNVQA